MNKKELVNKLLWLGYAYAEEGKERKNEAINLAHDLLDEYLETQCNECSLIELENYEE